MITLSLFLSATMVVTLFFVLTRKKNNKLLLIFVFMGIEYLFTSFISVIADNESLWRISEEPSRFFIFRIAEVILIPLLLLWYLELGKRISTFFAKVLLFAAWTFLLAGLEKLLILIKVIDQLKWELWGTFITWIIVLITTILLKKSFSSLLKKEGIN